MPQSVQSPALHPAPSPVAPARPADALDLVLSPPGRFTWRSVRQVLAATWPLRSTAWARNVRGAEGRREANMHTVRELAKLARQWGLADRAETAGVFRRLIDRGVTQPTWDYNRLHQTARSDLADQVRRRETEAETRIINAVYEASRRLNLGGADENALVDAVSKQLKARCATEQRPFHAITEDDIWDTIKPLVMQAQRSAQPPRVRD